MGEESRHRWLQFVFILKEISQGSPSDAEEIVYFEAGIYYV